MTETQRRFLREIGARVGVSRVHEVRLYPAIRQGGVESGVAIVAARPAAPEPAPLGELPADDERSVQVEPYADIEAVIPVVQDSEPPTALDASGHNRYEILSARYKLTLKGTERGAWEMELRHEADAPLDTIDRVVRGVALRAGEGDDPECIALARFRDALSDAPFLSDNELTAEYGAS